jgi:hypothetical protein
MATLHHPTNTQREPAAEDEVQALVSIALLNSLISSATEAAEDLEALLKEKYGDAANSGCRSTARRMKRDSDVVFRVQSSAAAVANSARQAKVSDKQPDKDIATTKPEGTA